MNTSDLPCFELDASGSLVFWNKGCEELTGCTAEEALGTACHRQYFAAEGAPSLADRVLGGGLAADTELIALGQCGWLWLNQAVRVNDSRCQAHALAFPVPESNRVRQHMLVLENHESTSGDMLSEDYRILAENIGDGFLLNQNDRLVLINKAFARLLGYERVDDLIGKHIADLILPTHREQFMERHYNKLNGGIFEVNTWPHVTQSGEVVWLKGHPKRIIWNGKHAILSTLVNVTDAYRREQRMQRETERLRRENTRLKYSLKKSYHFQKLVGKSDAMQHVYELLLRAAEDTANVIIYGESGTGKELAAQAIHSLGPRSQGPFVAVNCGAIPEELLESEFFGVKRGAFTGAYTDKIGYMGQACKGTLFLDEVGELPPKLQVKLLRAIDTGTYSPVGSPESKKADIRIVAATNRDLVADVAAGLFRDDLFYRLHVIPVHLPPLRDRKEDIPLLLEHFASQYAKDSPPIFPREFMRQLYAYSWPGNIREFSNTIQRYMTLGILDLIHSREFADGVPALADGEAGPPAAGMGAMPPEASLYNLETALRLCEQKTIESALIVCNGNRSAAARLLGVSRRSLYRKLSE